VVISRVMKGKTVLTIGTFDGVHRGHRAILERVRKRAEALRLPSVAYVFEIPPRAFLTDGDPLLLLPPSIRHKLIGRYVDKIVPARFSEIRSLTPEEFIADVVSRELNARAIIIGEGFQFGEGRKGDIKTMRALAPEYGYEVEAVPLLTIDQQVVSSTLIRKLISEGKIKEASRLLGRFPVLFGEVVRGDRIGKRLGYPTANLRIPPGILLPASSVYLTRAFISEGWEDGLLYIGRRPSVGGEELRCELHLLSPIHGDLYGVAIEVHILERLREDRAFPSLTALSEQIDRDVERARLRMMAYPSFPDRIGG